jgi:SNF2 family DNA or RNA helicase
MIRLRQLCLSPVILGGPDKSVKTEALLEILDEAIESGEKVVVFSWFKDYVKLLSQVLDKQKIRHVVMHGDTSDVARDQAKRQFRDDPDTKVFLSTIKTGGEGLNLQNASVLVFTDKSWVPGDNEQAEDRIHREGQTKNPLIISLVCKDTIEEDMETVLQNKERITSEAMAIEKVAEKLIERA